MSTPARHDADAAMSPAAALRNLIAAMEHRTAAGGYVIANADVVAEARAAIAIAQAHADVVVAAKLLADFCEQSIDTGPATKRPGREAAHWRNLRAALAAATPPTPPEDATND